MQVPDGGTSLRLGDVIPPPSEPDRKTFDRANFSGSGGPAFHWRRISPFFIHPGPLDLQKKEDKTAENKQGAMSVA